MVENFIVGEFWVGRDIPSPAYGQVLATARAHGVPIRHLNRGDAVSEDGVSLVMRLADGAESLLLTGDIGRPPERKILFEEQTVGVNFLKVPDHGSRTSTTNPFLSAPHPAFTAISVGSDNMFGHASNDVIDRMEAAGVRVFCADRDGAVTAGSDASTPSVTTFLQAQRSMPCATPFLAIT
ncbi:MAG TPA: hypothetical protein VGP19_07325 [Candidatus Acidoferrales bacterium]|jgi:competence protein ComEC|nr:hypothetical protein [Candidatus Acidoferrales bacterium]